MACRTCGNNGGVVYVNVTDPLLIKIYGVLRIKLPCPRCTAILNVLNVIRDMPPIQIVGQTKYPGNEPKRTKITVIPDACKSFPDEDDNALAELSDREVTDEITDTTIEDVLND